ncbi:MAG: hypothetical protein FJ288_15195 [Planctomycetes bacterium]|nr:hypothetical protein [Planctomycetota bacterium]
MSHNAEVIDDAALAAAPQRAGSGPAAAASGRGGRPPETAAIRWDKVRRARHLIAAGKLETPERIRQTAIRLLDDLRP